MVLRLIMRNNLINLYITPNLLSSNSSNTSTTFCPVKLDVSLNVK